MVDLLNEFENVAALTAAEALEELMVGMDTERRCLFDMERAQTDISLRGPYPPEADVLAHYTDNVNRSFDLSSEIQSHNDSASEDDRESPGSG